MFNKEKQGTDIKSQNSLDKNEDKPTPTYLRPDYPYQTIGEAIVNLDTLVPSGVLYEIKCPKCEMSIRSQGINLKNTYKKMINGVEVQNEDGSTRMEGGNGCIGCGNRELIIRRVEMKKSEETAPKNEIK